MLVSNEFVIQDLVQVFFRELRYEEDPWATVYWSSIFNTFCGFRGGYNMSCLLEVARDSQLQLFPGFDFGCFLEGGVVGVDKGFESRDLFP